jgi:hypothetical protein
LEEVNDTVRFGGEVGDAIHSADPLMLLLGGKCLAAKEREKRSHADASGELEERPAVELVLDGEDLVVFHV